MSRWSRISSLGLRTVIAASEASTSSVASATCSSAGLSISTTSKLALASASNIVAAFDLAAPLTRAGVAGPGPRTATEPLSGLGWTQSASAR
jgi:hypothetical protein